MPADVEHDLLLGFFASLRGVVPRESLLKALQAWSRGPNDKPLGQLLREIHGGDENDFAALEVLVARQLSLEDQGTWPAVALAAQPAVSPDDLEFEIGGLAPSAAGETDETGKQITTVVQPAMFDGSAKAAGIGLSPGAVTRYRIERPHARGALGIIWAGRDIELDREVALKEIRPEFADDACSRARFLLEAQVTGRLEHPGVVPVYGLGLNTHGRPFYAMRLVRGTSLLEAIRAFHLEDENPHRTLGERSIALRHLLSRFVDVCETIEYAHSQGILHRDLKPSNILVGHYGETLVVDWGIAKLLDGEDSGLDHAAPTSQERLVQPDLTMAGSIVGTPGYMSPEQARGQSKSLTPVSDVYSLGATLYTLLTGRSPLVAVEVKEAEEPPPPVPTPAPRAVNKRVPRALEAVCVKAMAAEPDNRYPSARALADDIESWMAGQPVSAWREPLSYRTRRFVAQHRTLFTSLVLGGTAALLGLATVLAVQARSNWELSKANMRLQVAFVREQRANQALEDSNKRAEDSRGKARHRFALALDAIRATYTGAGRDILLQQPQLEGLRKTVLGGALDFYQRLKSALEQEHDVAAKLELTDALSEIGRLEVEIGSRENALIAYRDALAISEGMLAEFKVLDKPPREVPRVQGQLVGLLVAIANLRFSAGRRDEALQLNERAVSVAETLAKQYSGVPERLEFLASATHERGLLKTRLGESDEAQALYSRSIALTERIARLDGDSAETRRRLATRLGALGDLQTSTSPDEALATYERTMAILNQLAAENPRDEQLKPAIARITNRIGMRQRAAGKLAEAEASHRRGLAILEPLVARAPAILSYQHQLAQCLQQLGVTRELRGGSDEAIAHFERAQSIQQKLVDDHPDDLEYLHALALTCRLISEVRVAAGQRGEAEAELRKAVDLAEKSCRGPLGVSNYQHVLGTCHEQMARLLRDAGRLKEAEPHARRAVEVLDLLASHTPRSATNRLVALGARLNFAAILARLGELEPALRLSGRAEEQLAALPDAPARAWYDAAVTCCAVAGHAEHPAAASSTKHAVDCLRKAVARGLRDSQALRTNPELAGLRDATDFQDLLRELARQATR